MNAKLISDLEIMRDKLIELQSLAELANEGTVYHEIMTAKVHVSRAIEWLQD